MKKNVRSDVAPETIVPLLQKLRKGKDRSLPVIAAVAGGSGDGKGYLISRLVEKLGDDVAVLALDNYYVGRARMASAGIPHFDHPDALDLGLAAGHLAAARVGQSLKIPHYDFPSGERVGEEDFDAKGFILVDGLFALRHPELLAAADLKIFVRSDHDSSMLRRLFRDAGPDGRTQQSSRDVLEQYFTTVWPAKKEFIDPTASVADVVVESCYDPAVEAHRAGPVQYQLKARGRQSDDFLAKRCKASRLCADISQTDRFMQPKEREHRGEMLRLRIERGEVLLTYKGPFADAGKGARPTTSPISLPMEAMKWFADVYAPVATFKKRRALFQGPGGIIIARDEFDQLGTWFEVRGTSEKQLPRMHALLEQLCPKQPVETRSYFEIWKERVGSRVAV